MTQMLGPDQDLLRVYGTGFYESSLEKTAQPPLGLRIAAPMAYGGMMMHRSVRKGQQEQEAALLTMMFRELEARKQERTVAGFQGRGGVTSAQGQAAQSMMPMLAYQSMMALMDKRGSAAAALRAGETLRASVLGEGGADGLEKRALGVSVFSKMLGAGKRSLVSTGRAVGRTGARATGGLQRAGAQYTQRGLGPAAAKSRVMATPGALTPRAAAGGAVSGAVPLPPAPRGLPSGSAVRPGGALGAPAAVPAAQQGVRKPLLQRLKPGWRAQAALGAGVAGTGYAGYKGLQATKDYMMQPTYASQYWGGAGMNPQAMVNQYGYTNVMR